jgi:hypothetical protein
MHLSNLLIQSISDHRFQNVKVDLVQNFPDSRKKFICKPELYSLEAIFKMSKQANKQTSKQANKQTSKQDQMKRSQSGE